MDGYFVEDPDGGRKALGAENDREARWMALSRFSDGAIVGEDWYADGDMCCCDIYEPDEVGSEPGTYVGRVIRDARTSDYASP